MTNHSLDEATLQSLRRRASDQVERHQWEAAQASLEALRGATPEDPRVALDLAAVMEARGLLRDATAVLLDVAKGGTSVPVVLLLALARKLYFAGELVTARSCLDQAELHAPEGTAPLVELARLRWLLGEYQQAYALSRRAIDSGADTPDASYLHATLAQYNGDIDIARTGLQQCLRKWPRFGEAAVALVHLEKQRSAAPLKILDMHLGRLQGDPPGPMQQLAMAQFQAARFKVLDDLGHADEAWQALERGNALMRALHPYDRAGEAAVCEALASASTHLAKRVAHATREDGPQPIFVVGLPRSGTTLLDRALSSHSAISSAGEINDFRRQLRWMTDVPAGGVAGMLEVLRRVETVDFAELGRRYLAQTQWRAPGKQWFVDKNPINVRMAPFIRLALPHAVIVHIHRAPMDVCYSNLKAMLGASSAYSYGMESMAHYYQLYQGLIDRWHRDCPGVLHELAYEELLRSPVATLTSLLDRCGLKLEPACLHPERNASPVATPSCNQVREAPHLRSLGEWRRYEARLEPLRAALNA
jgi:tetratricopeptide (TPR) repeat protein